MSFAPPPIVKLAERLMLEIEQAVRKFPRYHKYAVGADLRADSRKVAQLAHRAWRQRARQSELVTRLVWAVDDLKITMQLASQLRAFGSFGQFEALARIARDLGKQVGGWHRQQHPKEQSASAGEPSQRLQILSTHAASSQGAMS